MNEQQQDKPHRGAGCIQYWANVEGDNFYVGFGGDLASQYHTITRKEADLVARNLNEAIRNGSGSMRATSTGWCWYKN